MEGMDNDEPVSRNEIDNYLMAKNSSFLSSNAIIIEDGLKLAIKKNDVNGFLEILRLTQATEEQITTIKDNFGRIESVTVDSGNMQIKYTNNMKPTYYQPDISEFHVGFEFEVNEDGKYVPHTFATKPGFNDLIPIGKSGYSEVINWYRPWDIEGFLKEGKIRVKHLDRTDIEACGWEDKNSGGIFNAAGMFDYELTSSGMPLGFVNYGKPNTYRLTQMDKCWFTISATGHPQTLFYGTILNKSELLFQMKRLGIKTEESMSEEIKEKEIDELWAELVEFANQSIREVSGLIDAEAFVEQGKKRFKLLPK